MHIAMNEGMTNIHLLLVDRKGEKQPPSLFLLPTVPHLLWYCWLLQQVSYGQPDG